jgi:2-dehydro-3-deoxyphosphogluconate aldolase/(4S)-4-hydroxy-2-oxoglutarate aldolase
MPAVRVASADHAARAVEALAEGGIDVVEVTTNVPGVARVIEALAARYGDRVLVGAGTVLDAETARQCILAGARFVVAPALDVATVRLARRYDVPAFPGALTPTEVLAAWEAGATAVKVFPCDLVGGPRYLRALAAPLPQVALLPMGGVTLETAADYLRAGAFALGVGSDLVSPALLEAGRGGDVADRARRYAAAVTEARAAQRSAV